MAVAWVGMAAGVALGAETMPGEDLRGVVRGLGSEVFKEREGAQGVLAEWPVARVEEVAAAAEREQDVEVKARLEAGLKVIGRLLLEAQGEVDRRKWPWIEGRVADAAGKGMGGGTVRASAYSMKGLEEKVAFSARVDAEGKFRLQVPFAGIPYVVSRLPIRAGTGTLVGIVGATNAGPTLVDRELMPCEAKGRVLDVAGKGVVGAEVELIGQDGWKARTTTGEDGSFSMRGHEGFGWSILTARKGDLVSPYRRVFMRQLGAVPLVLANAAALSGRVVENDGTALGKGKRLRLRTMYETQWVRETQVREGGAFEFRGLPGGIYEVLIDEKGYEVSPAEDAEPGINIRRPPLILAAGGETKSDIRVEARAVVMGKVVGVDGKGVAGALVVVPEVWTGAAYRQGYVTADGEGKFVVGVPNAERGRKLMAYSAEGGAGNMELKGLRAGEVRAGVQVTLGGAARVRGVVKNARGDGVAGVSIRAGAFMTSRTEGGFDLGWVALPQKALGVQPPRPLTEEVAKRSLTFYDSQLVPLAMEAGKDVRIEVELVEAELVAVIGKVMNKEGTGVAGAMVFLLSSNAEKDNWKGEVAPDAGRGAAGGGKVADVQILRQAKADEEGRFKMWLVRDELRRLQLEDGETFCVGAYDMRGGFGTVRGLKGVGGKEDVVVTVER